MARRQRFIAQDDQPLYVVKRDLSGGMNTRQQPQMIKDNEAVLLKNILLETSGQTSLRTGQTLVDNNYPINNTSAYYLSDSDGNIITDGNGNYIPIPS